MPTAIAYVGRRPFHRDVTYGTGEWVQGQSKVVDDATAFRMLKHHDVYTESADTGAQVVEQKPDDQDNQDDVQDALDAIGRMDSAALCSFVSDNFQQKMDRRRSVEYLRSEATRMLHLYGLAS